VGASGQRGSGSEAVIFPAPTIRGYKIKGKGRGRGRPRHTYTSARSVTFVLRLACIITV